MNNALPSSEQKTRPRVLKIEADGDFWRGRIRSKIRLTGRWLSNAGFSPGNKVEVICLEAGLLQLRATAATPE